MSFTRNELDEFRRFAIGKIENGGVHSLEECLRQWRQAQEEEEAIADILEGLEDIKAGRVYTLEEVDAEIRKQFGFPSRDKSA